MRDMTQELGWKSWRTIVTCVPCCARKWTWPRYGWCARLAVICRNTRRPVPRRGILCPCAATPSWPVKSPCSRCAATRSMPPSSSPTSSPCPTPWGWVSTSSRGKARASSARSPPWPRCRRCRCRIRKTSSATWWTRCAPSAASSRAKCRWSASPAAPGPWLPIWWRGAAPRHSPRSSRWCTQSRRPCTCCSTSWPTV